MKITDVQKILSAKKRGRYFSMTYESEHNGYHKVTTTTVRLANYASVTGKAPSLTSSKASNDHHLGNNLIFNERTQKTRLQVFLTNNPKHKPHSVYDYMGEEITRDEYYEGCGKKPSSPTLMFAIDIDNIIAIY